MAEPTGMRTVDLVLPPSAWRVLDAVALRRKRDRSGTGRAYAAQPSGRRGLRRAAVVGSVIGVISGLGVLYAPAGHEVSVLVAKGPSAWLANLAKPRHWPDSPAAGQQDGRIRPLPAPAKRYVDPSKYAFMHVMADGSPVAYDPCRPVKVVVNPAGGPQVGTRLIREALEQASRASGIDLVYEGTSDEPWAKNRAEVQEDRYGKRWAPVLISWSTQAQHSGLNGTFAGEGGSTAIGRHDDDLHYVTGQIVLDGDDLAVADYGGLGLDMTRAVILHEVGHLLGLDHVDDPTQLLYPNSQGLTHYAAGDLAGLRLLGAGNCYPND